MQTKIIAGLVVATSCAILGSAFGGCSGNAYLEDPFGTDKAVPVEGGCVYEYENSLTTDGEPYRENAPNGTLCQEFGTCLNGQCLISCRTADGSPCECGDSNPCAVSDDCHYKECKAGKCGKLETYENGSPCRLDMGAGVCLVGICVECITADDCKDLPDSDRRCTFDHKCASCSNHVKDSDEADVDCGGNKCGKCNGAECAKHLACASEHCVDGVCCDSSCAEMCKKCNLPGIEGVCTTVRLGDQDINVTDWVNSCGGTVIFDGTVYGCKGTDCAAGGNGQGCMNDKDCISGACIEVDIGSVKIHNCKQAVGPCAKDEECASGKCQMKSCVP